MELNPRSVEHWLLSPQAGGDLPSRFGGLDPLGKSLILSSLGHRLKRPVIAIFESKSEARNAIDNYRFFAGSRFPVRYIPVLDADLHRHLLSSPEEGWQKNRALFHLLNDRGPALYVTTVAALIQKTLKPDVFLNGCLNLKAGDEFARERLKVELIRLGYQSLPTVTDPGSFAVRGGVVDVFSPLYDYPIRLEYFGDVVETLRFFESVSQRSRDSLEHAQIIPVRSSILPEKEHFPVAAARIKERLDHIGFPKSDRDELLLRLHDGILQHDQLFPLLSGDSSPITEYFPSNSLFVYDGNPSESSLEAEFLKLKKNHELLESKPSPTAALDDLVMGSRDATQWLADHTHSSFLTFALPEKTLTLKTEPLQVTIRNPKDSTLPLESLAKRFRDKMDLGHRIHLVCHTRLHAERIRSLLGSYGLQCEIHAETEAAYPSAMSADFQIVHLWQGYITASAHYPDLGMLILSEEAVFGRKKRVPATSKTTKSAAQNLSAIRDLRAQDFIVHRDHGVGRYLGLQSRNFLGIPNDYAVLEYRNGDKLYIPVYRLNVIQKFSSGEAAPPILDKLGGDRWTKAKSKAQKAAAELAAQFLETHALRKTVVIDPCTPPDAYFEQFEMAFPYDETPDQLRTLDDLYQDLEKQYPMSRLLCGDVGYGKTEIAMRAAYRIIGGGKQVAILVPTTILAFQHFSTFSRRFRNTPVRIQMISRLRSNTHIKNALGDLKQGSIDIIIGTHRLLSQDTFFKNLGLVVIDEEHRFGVVHKERLKKLCENVHVLSMTATPIPRTLNMAMAGIMDISIITTPPPDRLSVRTFVAHHDEGILREAIANELARDGQVYYVHNRIETIHGIAEELRALFPMLRFQVVHGQMDAEELERNMIGFFQNDFQVLVTTAIVESGLDNPHANTIIIDRADTFGLAQLYQLRGRVGRADRRAYCYLLIPGENQITNDAKNRLLIMQRYSDLGSGFQIASQDLDTRGAGDLLGQQQSGHINAVGIDLYFELLDEAIRDLQGKPRRIEIEPDINLRIPAYLPADYLPDIGERVSIYRRLSSLESTDGIDELETELRDRFGSLPPEVMNLLGITTLKLGLKKLHVVRMSCGPKRTSLQFADSTPANPNRLVQLIQQNPKTYSLTPDHKLVFEAGETDWKSLLREIELLSSRLGVTPG